MYFVLAGNRPGQQGAVFLSPKQQQCRTPMQLNLSPSCNDSIANLLGQDRRRDHTLSCMLRKTMEIARGRLAANGCYTRIPPKKRKFPKPACSATLGRGSDTRKEIPHFPPAHVLCILCTSALQPSTWATAAATI